MRECEGLVLGVQIKTRQEHTLRHYPRALWPLVESTETSGELVTSLVSSG